MNKDKRKNKDQKKIEIDEKENEKLEERREEEKEKEKVIREGKKESEERKESDMKEKERDEKVRNDSNEKSKDKDIAGKTDGKTGNIIKVEESSAVLTEKKTNDGAGDKAIEESILDEVKEQKGLLSIKDILDALSIIISTDERMTMAKDLDLIDVLHMDVEKPKEVEKLEPEISFLCDRSGEWCLTLSKMREPKSGLEDINSYPVLIDKVHHIVEGTVKEFFRLFRICMKKNIGSHLIIDPLYIGYDESLYSITIDTLQNFVNDQYQSFEAIRGPTYDHINVVMNPIFHEFSNATQAFLNRDAVEIRLWIEVFAQRKNLSGLANFRPIYGRNNVRWTNCSHPRRLPRYLSRVSNFNALSIGYALEFVFPECSLRSVDITQVSSVLNISSARAEALNSVVTSPVTPANTEDFRKILSAMVLPQQIQIEITYNIENNCVLNGLIGLLAKLLFSTTPGSRTITYRSALETDLAIGKLLQSMGYVNQVAQAPLRVIGREGPLWEGLATNEFDGRGWINHGVNARYVIENPLYDLISTLPMYGGINGIVAINDLMDELLIDAPPIFQLIIQCLGATTNRDAGRIQALINYLRTFYVQFLVNLNRFIIEYGETGLRFPDQRLNNMERVPGLGGLVQGMVDYPEKVVISGDSVYKFMLRLPALFKPSIDRVLKQPSAESLISAEIQRVFSMYNCIYTWLERDQVANVYKRRRVLMMVIENILSNRIAKKIFKWCFENGDIQRVDTRAIRGMVADTDDFEAHFFMDMSLIVYSNLEYFGVTRSVCYNPKLIQIPADVNAIRGRGIIASNTISGDERVETMDYLNLQTRLGHMDLLSHIRERLNDGILVNLPIYCAYQEGRNREWGRESCAFNISVDSPEKISMQRREIIKSGSFYRQFLLPADIGPRFPDQYFLGNPHFSFWYTGRLSLTTTSTAVSILGWHHRVESWKQYVVFKSPLEFQLT